MIKASGRSALLLATGLFVCFAAPSQAAPDTNTAASPEVTAGAPIALSKFTKQASRSSKKIASQKSAKVASKPSTDNKAAAADDAKADGSVNASSEMPPWVANANAQLASADTLTGSSVRAMSARANTIVQAAADNPAGAQPAADSQVVSADQLNDLDRALQESKPAAPAMRMASAEAPAAPAAPVTAGSSSDSSTWDQTSLIGKIFIGFGALLTVASAARMFMA
jgi:hypothetical protein